MFYRALILVLVSLAACTSVRDPSAENQVVEPGLQASRPTEFIVTLAELTQRPTPAGLPHRLVVAGARMVVGQRTAVTWRTLDGDSQKGPQTGSGTFELADTRTINIVLRAADSPDAPALTLAGVVDGIHAQGSFTDRLFYARAGSFVADIKQ